MAYNIIRPRKGIKSLWDQHKGRIYKNGEMLVESPETGIGTGPVNVKFGDGITSYENLPYGIMAPTDEVTEDGNAPVTSKAVFAIKKLIEAIDLSVLAPKSHSHTKSEITDFPSSMAPTAHSHTKSEISDFPSTMTPSAHNQAASTITEGTFGGQVKAPAGTDYTTARMRNHVLLPSSSEPTAGASSSYVNGTVVDVYE